MRIDASTRIYVAGCGGMLGDAVHRVFSDAQVRATDLHASESWLAAVDVRDAAALRADVLAFEPHVILNLAAITDLEACERDPDDAWRTNALGAEHLGLLANELDVPYVFISSAGVFSADGRDAFGEGDEPRPLGVYARSKVHGERWARANVPKHYVVRAGWMMGGGPRKDKKFVNKLFAQLRGGARRVLAVNDRSGTPTYTIDFALGLRELITRHEYGLYHQVCRGSATRYDVAVAFVEQLGLADSVEVAAVSSDHFAAEYFAPRPANESLVNERLDALGATTMRHWRECLAEYAAEFRAAL